VRIQGTFNVEGVELNIDIDTLDDEEELYVTNVHPHCLVIPKERWKVEFLGLPQEVIQELERRRLLTLGDLVDDQWEVKADGLDDATFTQVKEAVERFLSIAFVFGRKEAPEEALSLEGEGAEGAEEVPSLPVVSRSASVVASVATEEAATREASTQGAAPEKAGSEESRLSTDLGAVRLLKPQEEALRTRGITTFGDLIRLGRNRLAMTNKMDERGLTKIEAALAKVGLTLPE
jgi:hypothetical protein